ncbi:MAG: hypothetical protein ABIO60_04825 [Aquaticitalea sp.]
MKKLNKQYRIDLWLFIGSVLVLLYLLFMNYANLNKWENTVLIGILKLFTIPFILVACAIPMVVVFRFISKKTKSRTLSMLAVLISLVTAILIGYTSF